MRLTGSALAFCLGAFLGAAGATSDGTADGRTAISRAASATVPRASAARDFVLPPRARHSPLDELAADGRPTENAIALLRSHARGRVTRLWVDGTPLQVRQAGFDSTGVTFVGEAQRDERRGSRVVASSDSTDRLLGAPSIPWAAIDRLETQRSNVLRGALIGAFLMTIAGARLAAAAGPEPGPGIAVFLAFPPGGALIGGLIGAGVPRWQHEWPPATRP